MQRRRASKPLRTQEPVRATTYSMLFFTGRASKLLHEKAQEIWLRFLAAINSSNPARSNAAGFSQEFNTTDRSEPQRKHFWDSTPEIKAKHAAPPRAPPPRDRRGVPGGVRARQPHRRPRGGGRGSFPGRVRAGAGAMRVALLLGAGGGARAAAARPGQREPAAEGAGHRGRAPGAARRRGGVTVRLAEGHPHGRQVPAPRLLRRHQLRPRRQPRRATPPWPRRARRHWAWLVKTEEEDSSIKKSIIGVQKIRVSNFCFEFLV